MVTISRKGHSQGWTTAPPRIISWKKPLRQSIPVYFRYSCDFVTFFCIPRCSVCILLWITICSADGSAHSPFIGFKWFVQIFNDHFMSWWADILLQPDHPCGGFSCPVDSCPVDQWIEIADLQTNCPNGILSSEVYLLGYDGFFDIPVLKHGQHRHRQSHKAIYIWRWSYYIYALPIEFSSCTGCQSYFQICRLQGSIVYLAAISSLDIQLYEAAKIDGAGDGSNLYI